MALADPYMNYRQQQVNTASQDKLILLLFDGAIRFCRQAKAAIEKVKYDEASSNLLKAQNIVQEFMITLNMDYEIAHSLYYIYDYFYRRLVEANITKDPAIITEVEDFLGEMRATFAEASLKARREDGYVTGGAASEG
jgi:flagellar protein FliS